MARARVKAPRPLGVQSPRQIEERFDGESRSFAESMAREPTPSPNMASSHSQYFIDIDDVIALQLSNNSRLLQELTLMFRITLLRINDLHRYASLQNPVEGSHHDPHATSTQNCLKAKAVSVRLERFQDPSFVTALDTSRRPACPRSIECDALAVDQRCFELPPATW